MATAKRRDSERKERANRMAGLFGRATPTCYETTLLDKPYADHQGRQKEAETNGFVEFFLPGILMREHLTGDDR